MTSHSKNPVIPTTTLASLGGILLTILASGCSENVDTTYGRRAGILGGESVNGTAVLAEMFEDAGHRVRTKRYLTDALISDAHLSRVPCCEH